MSHDNILIITHKNPDGDTVGSAAALCSFLRRAGKTAALYNNPQITHKLRNYAGKFIAEDDFKAFSFYLVSLGNFRDTGIDADIPLFVEACHAVAKVEILPVDKVGANIYLRGKRLGNRVLFEFLSSSVSQCPAILVQAHGDFLVVLVCIGLLNVPARYMQLIPIKPRVFIVDYHRFKAPVLQCFAGNIRSVPVFLRGFRVLLSEYIVVLLREDTGWIARAVVLGAVHTFIRGKNMQASGAVGCNAKTYL